jgi:hypothetical protein
VELYRAYREETSEEGVKEEVRVKKGAEIKNK